MEDVIRAFESNTNAQDVIGFMSHHNVECLERADVAKANSAILKSYGIASDRRL
jgi:hypothetical protein